VNQHKVIVTNETLNKDLSYNFDRVFEPHETQGSVSEEV